MTDSFTFLNLKPSRRWTLRRRLTHRFSVLWCFYLSDFWLCIKRKISGDQRHHEVVLTDISISTWETLPLYLVNRRQSTRSLVLSFRIPFRNCDLVLSHRPRRTVFATSCNVSSIQKSDKTISHQNRRNPLLRPIDVAFLPCTYRYLPTQYQRNYRN
jgi:hypothetical protein